MKTSESIKEITTALVNVQSEIKGLKQDGNSGGSGKFSFSYITLDKILDYVRPILSKNGILLTQEANGIEGSVKVKTRLTHVSGEFMETDVMEMKSQKTDPQSIGSCITYTKRYQLSALLGISAEVDDDGYAATFGIDNNKISKTKVIILKRLLESTKSQESKYLKFVGFDRLEDITEGAFGECLKYLQDKKDKQKAEVTV